MDSEELERANEFRAWLRAELQERQWTQRLLADLSGLSESTVSGWLNDRPPPRRNSAIAIADALGISKETVFEKAGIRQQKIVDASARLSQETRLSGRFVVGPEVREHPIRGLESLTPVPVLGRAPADVPRWTASNEPADLLRTEDLQGVGSPALVIASGDCLIERGILDGTRVLIDQRAEPKGNGRDIVVIRIGDEITMKEWHPMEDGSVVLRASSDRYPPTYLKPGQEDVELIGVVHHWYRIQRP